MNCLVPDLAIVPRWFTMSALVIPTPVSITVMVLASLLGIILMHRSFSASRTLGFVKL